MDFIEYCYEHRILLAVLPPHSTHTLQPLDVEMFGPLSSAYLTELGNYLHRSHRILPIVKGDFFELFWRAYCRTFKPQATRKSFETTGIHPANPEVILKRFREASSPDESTSSIYSSTDWLRMKTMITHIATDASDKAVKKLQRSLHHISAQNTLLRDEIQGLKESLKLKKRHKKKSYKLQLNNDEVYHGGAQFWSPRKIKQAKDDEMIRQQR
jgi:hypothetical protein